MMTRARLADAALGLLVTGTVASLITADLAGERTPDALAYFWAAGLGALMLVRRRYPLVVLWLTVLGLFAYYAAGYPAIGLAVPAAAALFSAAEYRRLRWPVLAALVLLAVSYGVRMAQGQDLTRILGYELAGHVALMAAAIALGDSLRSRRELQDSAARLLQATAARERSQAEARLAAERAGIARELHDSLGHRATVITMHADVAAEALGRLKPGPDADAAAGAVAVIASASRQMLTELRQTVRALRSGEPQAEQVRSPAVLAALDSAVFQALPLKVEARIQPLDEGVRLPARVEAAAYRIVQESLTNVARHSAAGTAEVAITVADGAIEVTVRDPGPAQSPVPATGRPGTGLTGMRERAAALGGTLTAGPEGDGYAVRARLPLLSPGGPS